MTRSPIIQEHLAQIHTKLEQIFPSQLGNDFCLAQSGQNGDYDTDNLTYAAQPLHHLLSLGGKRWRPLALTLSAAALNVQLDDSLDLACLIELVHDGSLIVDDIEDASPLRRGQPAAHIIYGEGSSINIANHAYFLGSVVLEKWPGPIEQQMALFCAWARSLRCLHIGQGLDIAWHQQQNVYPSVEQYLTMCRMKTGALSYLAGEMACILANLDKDEREVLAKAWQDVGVGFQILDDVKNLTTGMKGKMIADDLIEGKKSLPIILAAGMNKGVKQQLTSMLSDMKELTGDAQQSMIQQILQILDQCGVLHQSAQQGVEILTTARESMRGFFPKNKASKAVIELLENLTKAMT